MRWRRALVALVLVMLAAAAGAALARSAGDPDRQDPVRAVSAGLRCPACQGESVADSRSPIAAAMRQVVADQLAQGRDRTEIRRWFVQRYGADVLTDPPARGVRLLLWGVPALALLAGGYAAVRTLRPGAGRTGAARTGSAVPWAPDARGARRAWRVASAGVVALVASVAIVADRLDPPARPAPADPVAVALQLAHDLETQNRYDAAAQMYQEALRDRPDDDVRLRLAFAQLRAGDGAAAQRTARDVLAREPASPDGLLVLGLAQRNSRPVEAVDTLRRFLAVAPEHPAAAEIRRLLATGREPVGP
ncbi:tetratricopeptide repeat protein [Micromonospora terminaliae]|uniref:Cytochrome c-type biogenesis protein n=1 Tax=Micromonospora terminaliae TaxID=1914461 RepID=A0AAJ2ZF04_9ACTN|nr:cytochrome c-type biogenesis protein [Micromonospora terminaliae]NES27764.1 tetratricopeptide repeat protein [Micromonospora terminaliae]QGL47448.1 tetratricopeptide repeat protein [Micromonospora terminaliae]